MGLLVLSNDMNALWSRQMCAIAPELPGPSFHRGHRGVLQALQSSARTAGARKRYAQVSKALTTIGRKSSISNEIHIVCIVTTLAKGIVGLARKLENVSAYIVQWRTAVPHSCLA